MLVRNINELTLACLAFDIQALPAPQAPSKQVTLDVESPRAEVRLNSPSSSLCLCHHRHWPVIAHRRKTHPTGEL